MNIERNRCIAKLDSVRENGFPKVITGIRRCGKSYLLDPLYKNHLIESGVKKNHILSIRLDDIKNAGLRDPIELTNKVLAFARGKGMCYVFLDEIQEVYALVNPSLTGGKRVPAKKGDKETIDFVDVILGLSRESNIDLYVTGSNAEMLSEDIETKFRDKATIIPLSPLSFEEYHRFKGGQADAELYEYMQYGGMPLAILKEGDEKRQYLKDLFELTYFKDIIEHNHLNRGETLDELCNILSESSGQLLNATKIASTYGSVKNERVDEQTVSNYLDYFKNAFLIREARRFDLKGRKEIGALRKYYFCDTGLRNARLNFAFPDEGQMLENIVYNELLYHGFTVNVGTFDSFERNKDGKNVRKTNEIDFFAEKGFRSYYLQICLDFSSEKAREREIRPYHLLRDQAQKIIVLNQPIQETRDANGYTIIGAADFLLRFLDA